MERLKYIVVGSGYRAKFFARVAKTWPEQFEMLYFLCRSEEKAQALRRETGIAATLSARECAEAKPDFVVVAVGRDDIADVAVEWAERGFAVVTETPAGSSLEDLARLWELHVKHGARIQTCEQYWRNPLLAAGLRAVAAGKIGEPRSAYLSFVHDYHAASMMRRMLQVPVGEPFVLHGTRMTSPVVETDGRGGALYGGEVSDRDRDMIHVAFASGKEAFYDFSSVQYRSFIRSRHLTVRGTAGEWSDTLLYRLDEGNEPAREMLLPLIEPRLRALDTQRLKDLRKTWNPELFLEQDQDDLAIASHLLDVGAYLAGGPEAYPLRDALEDAYMWLLFSEAVQKPFAAVASQRMPWHEGREG